MIFLDGWDISLDYGGNQGHDPDPGILKQNCYTIVE